MPIKCNPLPSRDELLSRFAYNPETGDMISKNGTRAGKILCKKESNGYIQVTINDRHFLAQRVIWKMVTGEDPPEQIDHEDFDRSNNRWKNLRPAAKSQNAHHLKSTNNKHGFRGVFQSRGWYSAKISHNGDHQHLGTFKTAEAAHTAYREAAERLFGDFATTSDV